MMELSKEEISFLIECLEWNKRNYKEKTTQYNDTKKMLFSSNVKKMESLIDKLKLEKNNIKD